MKPTNDNIYFSKKDKALVRSIEVLHMYPADSLMCKCGHKSDSHIHPAIEWGNYLGKCNARLFTCKCKDFEYAYKTKPKDLISIGHDFSGKEPFPIRLKLLCSCPCHRDTNNLCKCCGDFCSEIQKVGGVE